MAKSSSGSLAVARIHKNTAAVPNSKQSTVSYTQERSVPVRNHTMFGFVGGCPVPNWAPSTMADEDSKYI